MYYIYVYKRGEKLCGTQTGGLLHSGHLLAQRSVGSKCRFSHKSIYVRSIVHYIPSYLGKYGYADPRKIRTQAFRLNQLIKL